MDEKPFDNLFNSFCLAIASGFPRDTCVVIKLSIGRIFSN